MPAGYQENLADQADQVDQEICEEDCKEQTQDEHCFAEFVLGSDAGLLLTYRVSQRILRGLNLDETRLIGQFFVVSLRGKPKIALLKRLVPPPDFVCADAIELLEEELRIPSAVMQLAGWIALYYLSTIGKAFALVAPGFLWNEGKLADRKKRLAKNLRKGFSAAVRGELACPVATKVLSQSSAWPFTMSHTSNMGSTCASPSSHADLTLEQQQAVNTILQKASGVTLLYGVTGSGKTEVYLELARTVLMQGKAVLVLVPEIALTPQMSMRFRTAFGDLLAILHSGLTPTDYEKEWVRVNLGLAKVVLGVRSAIFCPIRETGLIIVDEEHDSSYKCDENPCYNARDVAVKRASIEKCLCVLGSATPSVETYFNFVRGRYQLAALTSKFSGVVSKVDFVDVQLFSTARGTLPKSGNCETNFSNQRPFYRRRTPLSSATVAFGGQSLTPPILEALSQTKAAGEQAIVIINRRGFANYAVCAGCATALMCPNCAVSTTLHQGGQRELCHYCGFTRATLQVCQNCGGDQLIQMGTGTQNIEAELAQQLPEFKTARLDRDVLTSNTRLHDILRSFRGGEIDALIGTQILSKGHDFPKVSLVVLLHVDEAMLLPDFRSFERAFQLIAQSCGRAGRGNTHGHVLIQTFLSPNEVMRLAVQGQTMAFLQSELERRQIGWLPPCARHIQLEFKNASEQRALQQALDVRDDLTLHWRKMGISNDNIRLAGPVPAILEKLKEKYRFHICITLAKDLPHWQLLEPIFENPKLYRSVKIDVDPFSYL